MVTRSGVEGLAQWARVAVLLHLGGEAMIGTLALASAACLPVFGLAALDLRGVAVTDAKRQFRFGDYLALRLATSVLALLVVAGIALAAGYDAQTAWLLLVVAVAEVLKAISDICHAPQHQNGRMDRLAISMLIRSPLAVGLMALGLWWTGSLLWAAMGFPAAALLTLLCYDLPNAREGVRTLRIRPDVPPPIKELYATGLRPRSDPRTALRLAAFALPMGVVTMILALQVSIPRYAVECHLGRHALGVFVSITCLTAAGLKVAAAIGQPVAPRLARHYAAGDTAAFCRLLVRLMGFVLLLGAGGLAVMAAWGRPLLGLLYNEGIARFSGVAVFLMAAAAVSYLSQPLALALLSMRRLRTRMVVRSLGTAVLAVLAPVLAVSHGLNGVAGAILAGNLVIAAGAAVGVYLGLKSCSSGGAEEASGNRVMIRRRLLFGRWASAGSRPPAS